MIITSAANPTIKLIRKLKDRKNREESGLFFLEGPRIVIEAVAQHGVIERLIYCKALLRSESAIQAVEVAEKSGLDMLEVSPEVFSSFSVKDGPQGLAAIGRQKWYDLQEIPAVFSGLWLVLYQVADPGNLGTMLRSLDGMGGKGVILLDHCTDPYDPSSMRASMGAILTRKLVRATSEDFIHWTKKYEIPVIGTSDQANLGYRSFKYPQDMFLVMGSEREGLPQPLVNICDQIVSIPMVGKGDSLNLSVAASIILYEYLDQNPVHNEGD